MTDPPAPEPGEDDGLSLEALARRLANLSRTAGANAGQLAAHDQQLRAHARRMDQVHLEELASRVEVLAGTVAEVLEAAAPKGPPVPRWDTLAGEDRREQLDLLRSWVDRVLRPQYLKPHGPYEDLAECWPRHRLALWELSALAAAWAHVYVRAPGRPAGPYASALEWFDRWLPGAMRRVAETTRECVRTGRCTTRPA